MASSLDIQTIRCLWSSGVENSNLVVNTYLCPFENLAHLMTVADQVRHLLANSLEPPHSCQSLLVSCHLQIHLSLQTRFRFDCNLGSVDRQEFLYVGALTFLE